MRAQPRFESAGKLTQVTFRVRGEISHGEQLAVKCGSVEERTTGEMPETLVLVTTPSEYPIWRSPRPLVVPSHVPLSYTVVVLSGGDSVAATTSARRTVVPTGVHFEVEELGDIFSPRPPVRPRSAPSSSSASSSAIRSATSAEEIAARRLSGTIDQLQMDDLVEGCIYITSFTLPVFLTRDSTTGDWCAEWDECALHAKTEDSCSDEMTMRWVGTVQMRMLKDETGAPFVCEAEGDNPFGAEREKLRAVLAKMKCIPLFLPTEQLDVVYRLMCKEVLWPAMHNTLVLFGSFFNAERGWNPSVIKTWWSAYQAVCKAFSTALVDVLVSGDVVWVHDYHLMKLPLDIRTDCAAKGLDPFDDVGIIYFSHLPFPTWEIFRSLPWRDELLNGIIAADLVGFHTFTYARHFLQACHRTLGVPFQSRRWGTMGVNVSGRTVTVTVNHIGIEPQMLRRYTRSRAVHAIANELRAKHRGKAIVAGVDACQRLQGVPNKLLAFERLLDEFPEHRGRTVLLQRCIIPHAARLDDCEITRAEIALLVARIRKKHGAGSVDYAEVDSVSLQERLGIWMVADVLLQTPIRQGLSLNPLEYIFVSMQGAESEGKAGGRDGSGGTVNADTAAEKGSSPHIIADARVAGGTGVVILSEFAMAAQCLNGVFRVNPYAIEQIAISLDRSLSMSPAEKLTRMKRDIGAVSKCSASAWSRQLLYDLKVGSVDERKGGEGMIEVARFTKARDQDVARIVSSQKNHAGAAVAVPVRASANSRGKNVSLFSALNVDEVSDAYSGSKRRLLFFDYGGTLVEKENRNLYTKHDFLGVSHRKPAQELVEALRTICRDPSNVVIVVTALPRQVLLAQLGNIPELVLAAENGRFVAFPPSKKKLSDAFQAVIKEDRLVATTMGGSAADAVAEEDEEGEEDGAFTPPAPASPMTPALALKSLRKSLKKKPTTQRRLMSMGMGEVGEDEDATAVAASKAIDAKGSLTGHGLEGAVRVTSWRMSRLLKGQTSAKAAKRLWVRNEAKEVAFDSSGTVIEPQWKKLSMDVMRKYAMVVSGSTIEDNGMQVEFSFKNADPEWGYEQAQFLTDELSDALQHFKVTVSLCRGNVTVTPRGAGKGRMMCQLLKTFEKLYGAPPDFILAVGDEVVDEEAFVALYRFMAMHSMDTLIVHQSPKDARAGLGAAVAAGASLGTAFTCTVGRKASHASFFVNAVEDVTRLVEALAATET